MTTHSSSRCDRPPAGWRCNLKRGHDGPCPTHPDVFGFADTRSHRQQAWDHVGGPWSTRRAWGLVCAALAAVPGVRRHVLSTTPLKSHPMFDAYERLGRRS